MVVFASRSRTNTSSVVSPSSEWRFDASELNATKRPSAEIAAEEESSFPLAPAASVARLTSVVVFVSRSRTNTSKVASVSSGCRFEAPELKATKRPSAEIAGTSDSPFPFAPATPATSLARLTSVVVLVSRSRTSTSRPSRPPSVSSGWRFEASDVKATSRPSAEIAGQKE